MERTPAHARHRRGSRGRAWPPLAGVLAVALSGIGLVMSGRLYEGGLLISVAVLLAAVARALLPERSAGLLAVRSRALDVLMLGLLGGGLLLLTILVNTAR